MHTADSTSSAPSATQTVFVLPVFNDNPYQAAVAQGYRARGLNVVDLGQQTRFRQRIKAASPNQRINPGDILHLHWLERLFAHGKPWQASLRAWLVIRQLRKIKAEGMRIVWTVHNLQNHEQQYVGTNRRLCRITAELADVIIAHCDSAKRMIIEAYGITNPDKIQVVPHGHYIDLYPNTTPHSQARTELNLPDNGIVFLMLGQLRDYKQADRVMKVFHEKLNADANTHLVIAGRCRDEALDQKLSQLADQSKQIHYHEGFVPDDKIQVYMNAADVVLCPYRDVLTSGAVVLAMSFGKACIALHRGCNPDMLQHEGNLLIQNLTDESLAAAMQVYIDDPTRSHAAGEANLQEAQQWHWSRFADTVIDKLDS